MFDITRFIYNNYPEAKDYGNPVTDLQISCPFCVSNNKLHMHVSIVKNVVHCFKCGYGGSWITFVMDVLGCSYVKALSELYVVPKIRHDITDTLIKELQKKPITHNKEDLKLPEDFTLLGDSDSHAARQAIRYMSKVRGFTKEDWEFYNIGICIATLPMRVVIPIEDGYYQARAIPSWLEPKYLNPKSEARYYLFNSAALELYDEVVICEGAFSAMAVGRNAVALIGKELPYEKLQRLLESPVKDFIIALDYGAGKFAVSVADSLYKGGKSVKLWKFKDERDPADGGVYEELPYSFGSKLKMML
jgi:DNA primase